MKSRAFARPWISGLAFLAPNILGFLAFTLVPLLASFVMAFTDWDVQRHNQFRQEALSFVGWDNFARLFAHPDFQHFFGNTLFMMMGLPLAIAGSLAAAVLLTRVGHAMASRRLAGIVAGGILVVSVTVLWLGGMREQGVLVIFGLLAATILVGGVLSQGMLYRTLFYIPHFTAGVATYVLWKKLYNPQSGPINRGLEPLLGGVETTARAAGPVFSLILPAGAALLFLALAAWHVRRLLRQYHANATGPAGFMVGLVAVAVPVGLSVRWLGGGNAVAWLGALALVALGLGLAGCRDREPTRRPRDYDTGLGGEMLLALVVTPVLCALTGLGLVSHGLPGWAAEGLVAPAWLGDYHWAKPSLMLMALWAAIGSNNMILYLAGLSNIPPELYEAADIDGASGWQRFCHITWPQLAPITFFISVMGVIHGLQGGFEMARTMTAGGPAGSTTTLSYFIYLEGFETGRLGYASAVAWVLFAFVFCLSIINVKFGNRYVNE